MTVRRRRSRARLGAAAAASLAAIASLAPPVAVAKPAYVRNHAPYRAQARFVVTYFGSGGWRTVYHATPPNPNGGPDVNDARDSSTQAWILTFDDQVTIPRCGPRGGEDDPCGAVGGLDGAAGATRATGRIRHTHDDGVYPELDSVDRCDVAARTRDGEAVAAAVEVGYDPAARRFALTALEPVGTVLLRLPQACPGRGDPIDRVLDNYFTPGFSFAQGYGPERWFRSQTVEIPARVFHHASEIMVPLRDTRAGRSPRDCRVEHPEYERCRTGGAWSGVLTFRAPRS